MEKIYQLLLAARRNKKFLGLTSTQIQSILEKYMFGLNDFKTRQFIMEDVLELFASKRFYCSMADDTSAEEANAGKISYRYVTDSARRE